MTCKTSAPMTYLDGQVHYSQIGCYTERQQQVKNGRLYSETDKEIKGLADKANLKRGLLTC